MKEGIKREKNSEKNVGRDGFRDLLRRSSL